MYRGSRVVAAILLLLTGFAVLAFGLLVLPSTAGDSGSRMLVVLAVAFGVAHFVALLGLAWRRSWGRALAVSIAEAGGGLALAALLAVVLGADPLAARSSGTGLLAWSLAMYALLGASAGRIRFAGWSRRSHWWPSPLLRVARRSAG